ncbi:dihydrofolate reductase family protein [Lentzea sp. NPDC004782]|uniref:RibD family protein n=1 Tax=Lentzea sp. NPDC004782 TaxID=3154458 RepID=UPI0033A2FC6F
MDGRIALSPGMLLMFDERWPVFTGSGYADVKRRHHPQVILEGSGSFVTDDHVEQFQPPTETAEELQRHHLPEHVTALATQGWLVVPDSRGRVRWVYKQFPGPDWQGWHLLVLVTKATPLAYLSFLRREDIPYLVIGELRVDLPAALEELDRRFGVRTVVSTGGGRLNGALLRAGLLDEIEIEVVPIAVGGTTTPILFTAADLPPDGSPTQLRLLAAEPRSRDRVLLRYQVTEHGK